MTSVDRPALTKKDYKTDQEVRWCPGCGDYSILNAVQGAFAKLGKQLHETVIISGIGCSSRFPYYMETFGFHTIHGRAPAIATGVKVANPALDVWVVTGDGDALSIGGNHFIHAMRRNVGLKILLFNNRIYGLTKGQFSPTSEQGKVTKSSPLGTVEYPFSPIALALGAGGTFIARGVDVFGAHLEDVICKASAHSGLALVGKGGMRTAHVVTQVEFRPIEPELMDSYVATGEWKGRAGGCDIQGAGSALVKRIDGDYLNVVGLPMDKLLELEPNLLSDYARPERNSKKP